MQLVFDSVGKFLSELQDVLNRMILLSKAAVEVSI